MYNICMRLQRCMKNIIDFFSSKKENKTKSLVEIKHQKMDDLLLEHYLIYPNK